MARRSERDSVRDDHGRFRLEVEAARANREFVQRILADSRIAKVLGLFEREIDEGKEALVTTDKKDIERAQANILARRGLLATLRAAYQNELDEAQRQLAEFEKRNALFLQGKNETANEPVEATA